MSKPFAHTSERKFTPNRDNRFNSEHARQTAATRRRWYLSGGYPGFRLPLFVMANLGHEVVVESPHELRPKAEKYRRLASIIDDPQAVAALRELAARYEAMAAALEAAPFSSESDENRD